MIGRKNLLKIYLKNCKKFEKLFMHNGSKDIDTEDLYCKLIAIAGRFPNSMPLQEVIFFGLQQKLLDSA